MSALSASITEHLIALSVFNAVGVNWFIILKSPLIYNVRGSNGNLLSNAIKNFPSNLLWSAGPIERVIVKELSFMMQYFWSISYVMTGQTILLFLEEM